MSEHVHWGWLIAYAIWILPIPKFTESFLDQLLEVVPEANIIFLKVMSVLFGAIWPILIIQNIFKNIGARR